MGEGRRLGGLPITAIATCAFALALAVCTTPIIFSVACFAQVAACAFGALVDIVGNLSDANLVATENAEQYTRCLDWLRMHLGRIALEMDKFSIGTFAALGFTEAATAKTANRQSAFRTIYFPAKHIGAIAT